LVHGHQMAGGVHLQESEDPVGRRGPSQASGTRVACVSPVRVHSVGEVVAPTPRQRYSPRLVANPEARREIKKRVDVSV